MSQCITCSGETAKSASLLGLLQKCHQDLCVGSLVSDKHTRKSEGRCLLSADWFVCCCPTYLQGGERQIPRT